MRRGLDPFRAVPLFNLEERIECASFADGALFLGTAQGNLVRVPLALPPASAPSEELASAATGQRKAAVRLSQRRPVEQVCVCGPCVLSLCDGAVSVLPSADLGAAAPVVLGRDARCVCAHTGQEEGQSQPEVCVSYRKKLVLYSYNGRSFEQRQEFPTSDAASALAWHQSWICAGFRKEYNLYSDRAGVPREICGLDGKVTPRIAVVSGSELLLMIQENVGLFFNLSTQQPSSKSTVTWPRKVVACGAAGNYILGSTGTGQVDIFGVRDQKNCQTLTTEGAASSICVAAGGRALVAAEASVTCLDPVPFDRQVQKLLIQARITDALDLLNATFGPEDPNREAQLSRLHAMAGWALFRDLQFLQAFHHFMYSLDVKIARILVFWRHYLPTSFDPAVAGGKPQDGDGAPEPCSIEDFVRARLAEKSSEKDASASAVTANIGMANAAVVTFLLRQREALQGQERLAPEERNQGAGDPGQLLQAVDTALLKLLIEIDEDDFRLQQVLEGGVRCPVEDLEAFLRERRRLDVLARLWKAHGRYDMVLQEWGAMLRGGGGAGASPGSKASIPRSQIVLEMASALKSASSSVAGADLLRRYVPELLAVDPAAILPVFAGPAGPGRPVACPLAPEEVLELLGGHEDLVRGYLEQLVASKKNVDPKHSLQLALGYVAQVAEDQRRGDDAATTPSPARRKLLRFLEEVAYIDASALLPRVEELKLLQEVVVLHSRENRHSEALRVLVEGLNDLPRAEIYCRIVNARWRRQHQRAASTGSAEEPSIFCTEPPAWARGVVFGSRRSASSSASAGAVSSPSSTELPEGPSGIAGEEGAPRPFMLFLQVLLDASQGAEQRPADYRKVAAEYKDAALSFLMGYAGHRDLPPHEVIGVLPANWPLDSLAPYLAKCARACLHERRATMLEESLSSMAYLKTFSAWATERMRKVTITNDRCCPTCNRRFVDKDAVGKAFVAYPNETCVHLQCKEDLSVCPKTGQSFADNLSVYCSALGDVAE